MASQNHLKGFTALQTLSKSNLREVTTDKLAEISLKALENGNDTAQVFKFWADEVLNAYNLADFEANILNNILCIFADYTIQAIPNSAVNCITEQQFSLITQNLGKWQSVLSKVDPNLQRVPIVLTIIICALRVLASYYTFLKNSTGTTAPSASFCTNGLRAVLNDSQHLQSSILSIILHNPTYFLCGNFTDIPEVAKVMECLIVVGKIVPGLDVRLTAEIWKTISKISSENSKYIIATETVTMFLSKERPIKFLCEEIRKSLCDIYQSNMKPEIVERILKISSFYLKLLIKFASDYSHQYFVDNNEVIITFLTVLSPPENLKNTPVNTLTKQYLTIGFINLVSLIYKNRQFVESLCKINVDSNIRFEAFFCLSSEVLKLLISEETAAINLYLTGNFIEKIFEAVTKYPITSLERVNYEIIVTSVSALMLSICNETHLVACLESCLIRGVLQNDLLLASICIDIWHTLSREMRRTEQSELLQSLVISVQTDSQILVRSTARALFNRQSDSPFRAWNDSEIKQFLPEQCINKFSRRCYKDISNQEENPAKRLKMEIRRDDDLKRILCNVNKFANTHKDVEFSTSDLAIMNEIKNIGLRLCNK